MVSIILLVFFVIIAVLLVLLVLIQTEDGNHLGGLFAGGSDSAFGSRSGNVLTRATTVLGALFLIVSLGLALLSRTSSTDGVLDLIRQEREDWVPGVLFPQDDSNLILDLDQLELPRLEFPLDQ
jgi:preprotein translocase subunit SecG